VTPLWDSLRGRLIAAMLFVFTVGLGVERAADKYFQALERLAPALLREPYQDIVMLVPLVLGAVALIWLVSGWSLRGLAATSRQAASFGPATTGARLSSVGLPHEVRPLVEAVNGALDRLAVAYQTERRFVADAAHALRTPLAVLTVRLQRARLAGTLDWQAIDGDVAALNKLVAQLLDLARKEHLRQAGGAELPLVNLSRVAREVAAWFMPLAEAEGRPFEVVVPASLWMRGRVDDLRDVLRNLLENALLHGAGKIMLTVEAGHGGSIPCATITVSDEGEGVPAESAEDMFLRFRKGRQDTPGHGLGLAIVRDIVGGHGGRVGFLTGPGARVRVQLPAVERREAAH
jgi:signal transduction histidine kinase